MYRSIALTIIFKNILEKVVKQIIENDMIPLHEAQGEFRQNISVLDQIFVLNTII